MDADNTCHQRSTGNLHPFVAPSFCHAVVMVHGIYSDGGWFKPFGGLLRGLEGPPRVPPCTRLFGFTWYEPLPISFSGHLTPDESGNAAPDMTPGIEQVIGGGRPKTMRRAGSRLATLVKEIRKIIDIEARGRLTIVAHSQGTVVAARAMAEVAARVDAVVLLASPLLRTVDVDRALIAHFASVPLVLNCASLADSVLAWKDAAVHPLSADWPIGKYGVDSSNVVPAALNPPTPPRGSGLATVAVDSLQEAAQLDEYRQAMREHERLMLEREAAREALKRRVVIPDAAPGPRMKDVIVNSFGHSDWNDVETLRQYPQLVDLFIKVASGEQHVPGCHHEIDPAAIDGFRSAVHRLDADGLTKIREFMPRATWYDRRPVLDD